MANDPLGWVCLHRSIVDWDWYDDANTMRLFIHCLLKANHVDKNWRGIDIKRGQFITSYDTLSKELKLSIKQIRTALTKLKRTGEVASRSNSQHTVLIIKNYDGYQARGKREASEGQARGKRGATTNNDNNKNNETLTADLEDSLKETDKEDLKLSKWIYEKVLNVAPKTKQPSFINWSKTIRLMREQDKLTHREMAEVFKWANNDDFWKINVLSPTKLRKNFGVLHAKSTSQQQENQTEYLV